MSLPVIPFHSHNGILKFLSGAIPAVKAIFSSAASIFLCPIPKNFPVCLFWFAAFYINDGKIFSQYKIFPPQAVVLCISGTSSFLSASVQTAVNQGHTKVLFPFVFLKFHLLSHRSPIFLCKIYFPRLHFLIPDARLFSPFLKNS